MYLTQHEVFDFKGGKFSISRSKLITPEQGIMTTIKIRRKGESFHFEAVPLSKVIGIVFIMYMELAKFMNFGTSLSMRGKTK